MSASDLVVAAGEGAELQILDRRHVGDDAAALHHLEDAAADDLVGIDAVDALAVEHDLAADDFAVLGLEQARDRLQRRRLAGAVGAEQRHDRALRHLEAEAAQHQDDLVVDHLDVADAEQRRGGWRRRLSGTIDFGCFSHVRLHRPACSSSPAACRVIQYSRGVCDQPRSRGVLDPRFAGMTIECWDRPEATREISPAEPLGLARQVDGLHLLELDRAVLTRSLSGASVAPATFMR